MQGPIPGESLTKEPRAAQYERPPKFTKPEEAFEAYLDKFDNPDSLDGLMSVLETGMPLSTIVTVMTREAVRAGVHSIDTAVILRPMVHEYIKALADEAGVDYVEDVTQINKEEQLKDRERSLIAARVQKQVETASQEEDDDEEEFEEPAEDKIGNIMQDEEPQSKSALGLMKRPGV